MFCSNCGASNSQREGFCVQCGNSLSGQYPQMGQGAVVRRTSGMAIASLVMGIANFIFLPVLGSILAVIFGIIARRDINRNPNLDGWGIAVVGLVLGLIGLLIFVFGLAFFALLGVRGIGI